MELKECPFCLGKANPETSHGRYGWYAYIVCDTCGAQTRTISIQDETPYNNEEEMLDSKKFKKLAKIWNRRGGER